MRDIFWEFNHITVCLRVKLGSVKHLSRELECGGLAPRSANFT
jgi:hypothetical protein